MLYWWNMLHAPLDGKYWLRNVGIPLQISLFNPSSVSFVLKWISSGAQFYEMSSFVSNTRKPLIYTGFCCLLVYYYTDNWIYGCESSLIKYAIIAVGLQQPAQQTRLFATGAIDFAYTMKWFGSQRQGGRGEGCRELTECSLLIFIQQQGIYIYVPSSNIHWQRVIWIFAMFTRYSSEIVIFHTFLASVSSATQTVSPLGAVWDVDWWWWGVWEKRTNWRKSWLLSAPSNIRWIVLQYYLLLPRVDLLQYQQPGLLLSCFEFSLLIAIPTASPLCFIFQSHQHKSSCYCFMTLKDLLFSQQKWCPVNIRLVTITTVVGGSSLTASNPSPLVHQSNFESLVDYQLC